MIDQNHPPRIAVVGHVEHVTIGRVDAVPGPGDIVHLRSPVSFPGGGGGVAFWQLVRSDAEVHLLTAIGRGEAGDEVVAAISAAGTHVHVARRDRPHTRCVAMIGPDGERTIVVVGEPVHPEPGDALPWELLARCDAAYFTAQDPDVLRRCRAARLLVVTARRRPSLAASGVRADAVVGSAADPREASRLSDYAVPPGALVLTEGAAGGRIETAAGMARFRAAPASPVGAGGSYGAGDSFAAAMTYHLACGADVAEACSRAAPHGAAVLRGLDPRDGQLPLGTA